MNYNKNVNFKTGFTLLELLIVLLISAVLALGVRSAYQQARLIWTAAESQRPIYQNSRLMIETLREELSCLYFPKGSDKEQITPFVLSVLPDGTTELSFYTLSPAWKISSRSSNIAKISYSFSKNDSNESVFKRTEQMCSGEKAISTQSSDVILKGLSEMNVWVLDPNSDFSENSWKSAYDSKTAPPKAVRIMLKWPQVNNIPETSFQTSMMVFSQTSLPPQ